MRCRAAFAELMTSLIPRPVVKHTDCKSSRDQDHSSGLQSDLTEQQDLLGDAAKNPDTLDLFLALPNMLRKLLQSDQGSLNKTLKSELK